ncbi:MAG TPA: hypothetical protein VM841_12260 [Actinomycetota bacterium]|nr:hypothetical protein [Actinomycetota bacterium]
MSASRRTILLVATAAMLLAVFAVLPAPELIFRRSPIVSDRIAGDVRRIAMTVEPDGAMHAALEVWTDSDWDIEYWSSITNLTPVARIVTLDLIEQRDASIAMAGDRLALAWIDVDAKAKRYALQVATKRRIDRSWAKPVVVAQGNRPLREAAVAIDAAGRIVVAYVDGPDLRIASVDSGSATPPARLAAGARRPSIALEPGTGDAVVAYEVRDGSVSSVRAGPLEAPRPKGAASPLARTGRAPFVAAAGATVAVAWAERDAVVVRRGGEAQQRVAAPGLGDQRPSIAFTRGGPVAAWAARGRVVLLGADGIVRDLTPVRGCCPSVSATGSGMWVAWLESRPGNAIHRLARLRYEGEPGRFTTGDRIFVTELPG